MKNNGIEGSQRRRIMSVSQEGYRSFGHMCCGLWDHRRNPAAKLKIGILLIAIGLIWLGAKAELLDFSWFQGIHFWPAVVILLGVWMVCKGFMQRKTRTIDKKTDEV
jgi:putative Mn2+ efflux pump MntP